MGLRRKTYTKAFKLDAIQQSYQRDNIRELADELGVIPDLVYRWRRQYEADPEISFPGHGNPKHTPEEAELARLQRENADLRLERDILKKAIGIFSKKHG